MKVKKELPNKKNVCFILNKVISYKIREQIPHSTT